MSESSLSDIVLDLKVDFHRLSKSSMTKDIKEWIKCYPEMIQPGIIERIMNQDWNYLAQKAKRDMKAKAKAMSDMKAYQKDISNILMKIEANEERVTKSWIPIKKRENWDIDRGKIAETLIEKGFSPERIEEGLSKLTDLKPDNMFESFKNPVNSSSTGLDRHAGSNLSYYMGNLLLSAVALFNKYVISVRPLKIPAGDLLTKVEEDLSEKEKSIWQALRDKDLVNAGKAAKILADWATDVLNKDMVRFAAAISKKRKQEPESTIYGKLGLQTGDIIRGLLLATALGKWAEWLANWRPSVKSADEWINAALSRDFPAITDNAGEVEISLLADDPSKYDGVDVTVYGVVGEVGIEHRMGKVISSAPVYDSSGKSVRIALPYIKLDSGGLVAGAYARIKGTWNAESKEINKPALHIGRRSLKEEGENNWLAWVEDSLRDIIEITPHYLSAGWSWEPGNNGAINSLRYGTWYNRRRGM